MSGVEGKQLPDGWEVVPLQSAISLQKGKKPKNIGEASKERNIPYIDIKAFETGEISKYCTDEKVVFCKEDDVLVVWDGARSGLVGFGAKGAVGSTIARINPSGLYPKYLYYFLQSNFKFLNTKTRGVGIPHIDPGVFNNIEFPLAPPEQQKRIVAKIEELFSHIDAGIAGLKRAKQLLKQYRQSVLKAAVTGELTKEWREQNKDNLEPATRLLKRILKQRRRKWEQQQLEQFKAKGKIPKDDQWKGEYKEPILPALLVELENPDEWELVSIDQVAEVLLGKMLDKAKHTTGKRLPYLRNINVRWGSIDTKDLSKMFFRDSELERYDLNSGDVLVCEGGEPGRSAVWESDVTMKYQKALHRVRFYLPLIPQYLVYLLEYFATIGLLERYFTGSTIKHFTKESFITLPFPLPPLGEMETVVKIVEEKFRSIRRLEDELQHQLMKAEKNKQSILASAFSGDISG